MKILSKDLRKGEIKVKLENSDDFWYLSQVIDAGDLVKGETFRKIKLGGEEDRKAEVFRKRVFIKLLVEKVEMSDSLRVSGTINEGPEDVPRGSYHTFNLEIGSIITIIKERWLRYQLEKINESTKQAAKILICVMDRENASFALMKKYGYDLLLEIEGEVQRKADQKKVNSRFYEEIAGHLKDYSGRYGTEVIIVASPAFWREELMKQIDEALKKKIILAACNGTGKNAIDEVLKRPEVKQALKQDRIFREMSLVEELLHEIKTDALAVYGFSETKEAVDAGAVRVLLVSDGLIRKARQEKSYGKLDFLMKNADKTDAEIMIVSSEHDGGRKLDGLGGIAGLLRYKLRY